MTRKTVVSYGVRGSVFKFVAFQKLLEGEAGYTVDEPGQIALAQAIEHAVRALIVEGALEGLWQFDDQQAGQIAAELYLADKEEEPMPAATNSDADSPRTNAQLDHLVAQQKAKRAQILAKRNAVHQRVGESAAPSSKVATKPRISGDVFEALLQILTPFNAETRRLKQHRHTTCVDSAI